MRQRMTGDFNEPIRFFGYFTGLDLLRLGLPVLVVVVTQGTAQLLQLSVLTMLLLGGVTGLAWYRWRPYGHTVDVHLYHLARWILLQAGRTRR